MGLLPQGPGTDLARAAGENCVARKYEVLEGIGAGRRREVVAHLFFAEPSGGVSPNDVPVVLIHGKAGYGNDMWGGTVTWNLAAGTVSNPDTTFATDVGALDNVAVYRFEYEEDEKWVDHKSVGGQFRQAIHCLYLAHGRPVVVVGHSLGGLVAQHVAKENGPVEKIGLVITLGTPYEGSQLAVDVDDISPGGPCFLGALCIVQDVLELAVEVGFDVNTEAGNALKVGSAAIAELSGGRWSGADLVEPKWAAPVFAIGTQILFFYTAMTKTLGLFGSNVLGVETLGDVVVRRESATGGALRATDEYQETKCHPVYDTSKDIIRWEEWLNPEVESDFSVDLNLNPDIYRVLLRLLDMRESACYHDNLPNTDTLRKAVLDRIEKYIADNDDADVAEPPKETADSGFDAGGMFRIAAGDEHSCVIGSDGKIECWGSNRDSRASPPDGRFSAVAAGDEHSCGINIDGMVECWGEDTYGGASPPAGRFSAVAAGDEHSCGINIDGMVECWGENDYGETKPAAGSFTAIGAGDDFACGIKTDQRIVCWGNDRGGRAVPPGGTFGALAVGDHHSCAIRTSNFTITCWGDSYWGEASEPPTGKFVAIAAGGKFSCAITNDIGQETVCWGFSGFGITDPPAGRFSAIAAGDAHSCGINIEGTVECWGENDNGQTTPPDGHSNTNSGFDAGGMFRIAAGDEHSCVIGSDGKIECWGSNRDSRASPPDGRFSAVAAGDEHSCGINIDGMVECWGEDTYGGASPPAGRFSAVAAGDEHSCGINIDGMVECWGENDYGETKPAAGSFTAIGAGDDFACGIKTDQRIVCWGNDRGGRAVPPGGTFGALAVGDHHSCAIRTSNFTITCWGDSYWGEASEPPTGKFVAIAAGGKFSCAITNDIGQETVCWGFSGFGITDPPAGRFSAIAAGDAHSCGINIEGTVECWGENDNGQTTPPDGG